MSLRTPSIRGYPPPDFRKIVLYHRVLGTLVLLCWLVVRFSGLDEGDDVWGVTMLVLIVSWLTGAVGGARLLLAPRSWGIRFYAPSALAVGSVVLGVASELAPVPVEPFPGPLTYALRHAAEFAGLAAAALGAWVGWSTLLPK